MQMQIVYEDFVYELDYFHGSPSFVSGPPEDCYPDDPEDLEVENYPEGLSTEEEEEIFYILLDLAREEFQMGFLP